MAILGNNCGRVCRRWAKFDNTNYLWRIAIGCPCGREYRSSGQNLFMGMIRMVLLILKILFWTEATFTWTITFVFFALRLHFAHPTSHLALELIVSFSLVVIIIV